MKVLLLQIAPNFGRGGELDKASSWSSEKIPESSVPSTNYSPSSPSSPNFSIENKSALGELGGFFSIPMKLVQGDEIGGAVPVLPLQWYLQSSPLKGCLNKHPATAEPLINSLITCFNQPSLQAPSYSLPRTDIRAVDAWKHGNQGRGVVIAIIDSLIQWNHPDLVKTIYKVGDVPDKLPGEVSGWDFVEDDPDTSLSRKELNILSSKFRDAFLLSSTQLRQKYPETFEEVSQNNPDASAEEVADLVRNILANIQVAREFHGTMVTGVAAARPQDERGLVGVAPQAQILPIRVLGLNGSFSIDGYLEAIAYAAARKADVINISLGSSLPAEGEVEQIQEVLAAYPKLAIVASAGNDDIDSLNFPAAIPGVVAVGATNINGNRAFYSNYGLDPLLGQGLTVVAPGGDNSAPQPFGRILTTGGTWLPEFWQGISTPGAWGPNLDLRGKYRWTQGTSLSSPAVAGAIALMKSADPQRRLTRDRLIEILKKTASYEGLSLTSDDVALYNSQLAAKELRSLMSDRQYFFGSGLVNADAAVREVLKGGMRDEG